MTHGRLSQCPVCGLTICFFPSPPPPLKIMVKYWFCFYLNFSPMGLNAVVDLGL
uniref:Uncharacterized protein n=1 Tax=Anguilla anguilla TaxID=7936 RepID=A0A0E9W4L7_ANGAN